MGTPEWCEAEDRPPRAGPAAPATPQDGEGAPSQSLDSSKPIPDCSCAGCHERFIAALRLIDQREAEEAAAA